MLLMPHELSYDDMTHLGWTEDMIGIGLQSDVSFVACLNTDDEYNLTRHLKHSSYEKLTNRKIRGVTWDVILIVWN